MNIDQSRGPAVEAGKPQGFLSTSTGVVQLYRPLKLCGSPPFQEASGSVS